MVNGLLEPAFFSDFTAVDANLRSQEIIRLKNYRDDFVRMPIETADNILEYYFSELSIEQICHRADKFVNFPNKTQLWLLSSKNISSMVDKFAFLGFESFKNYVHIRNNCYCLSLEGLLNNRNSVIFSLFVGVFQARIMFRNGENIVVNLNHKFRSLAPFLESKLAADVRYLSDDISLSVEGIKSGEHQFECYNAVLENLLLPAKQFPEMMVENDFIADIRHRISNHLDNEKYSIKDLADQLHTTPRTLQRKLSKLNTSFRCLKDDERRRVLENKLNQGVKIYELSDKLGYSDVSSLYKLLKTK